MYPTSPSANAAQPPGGWGPPEGPPPPPGGWGPPGGPPPPPGWVPPLPPPGGWGVPGWSPPSGSGGGSDPYASPGRGPAFVPTEAISFAWERIKADPATILSTIGCGLLLMWISSWVASAVVNMVSFAGTLTHGAMRSTGAPGAHAFDAFAPLHFAVAGIAQLINTVVYSFFYTGITRFTLKVARGTPYAFSDLFDVGSAFVPVLLANVLTAIAVALGAVFLVVPGIIFGVGLSLAVPLVVDRQLGAIEALTASWNLTNGHKLNIFALWGICALISVAGACACGVGLLVALPLATLAMSYAYLRLTQQPVALPAERAM